VEQIAENGDYNLSGDRYRVATDYSGAKWPMVELGDGKHFTIESGGTPDSKNEEYWNGDINWTTLADLPADNHITEINSTKRRITVSGLKNSSAKLLPINSVLVSSRATIGRIATNSVELATNQGFKNIVIKDSNSVNYKYVALALTNKIDEMIGMANGGTFAEISKSSFSKIKIPLPPLEIQEQIVRELNGYQSIIQGAKQLIEIYEQKTKATINKLWEE
jgi:type I restriction enzyme M protein